MSFISILAAEGGVEAPNPILPEPAEVIWGLASFLVVLLVLGKFLLPAVQKTMEERTERIRESIDEADHKRAEAQQLLDEYRQQLADAKAESNRIIEEARQAAASMRQDLVSQAQQEAEAVKTRATADIEAARERAVADLRESVAGMAIDLAEKVVERNIDRDANAALIESYLNSLENQRA